MVDTVTDRRVVVYPAYLDSSKTTAEGRRIAREKAVQGPTIEEIAQAATKVGFACEPEDKAYPRDWLTRGRLRVALRDDTGKLCSPDVRSRKDVYIKIAEAIRTSQDRVKRGGKPPPGEDPFKRAEELAAVLGSAMGPAAGPAANISKKALKKAKKGKK